MVATPRKKARAKLTVANAERESPRRRKESAFASRICSGGMGKRYAKTRGEMTRGRNGKVRRRSPVA